MRTHAFVVGSKPNTLHWKQHEPLTWEQFLDWLGLNSPADHKECGGYVVGEFQETTGHGGMNPNPDCVALHRNSDAVVTRSMITLDADSAGVGFDLDVRVDLGGTAMALYTTWRHTAEAPRWRVVIPLSEPVKPAEYRLIVGALMEDLGADQFDLGSAEPERFMYKPSTQGSYSAHVVEGTPLDVSYWLDRARALGLTEPEPPRERVGESTYGDLTDEQRQQADELERVNIEHWRGLLRDAARWSDGETDEKGRGWDVLLTDCAWAFAKMAACPWMSMDEVHAELAYASVVPDEMTEACGNKLDERTWTKAEGAPVDVPPWESGDFDVWTESAPSEPPQMSDHYDPYDIGSDLQLGKRVARQFMRGRYLAWGKTRWAAWDGRRWDVNVSEDLVNGVVREALLSIRLHEIGVADRRRDAALRSADSDAEAEKAIMKTHEDRMKAIARLRMVGVLEAAKKLARPDLSVGLEDFDGPDTADLLNVGNGVVDLRTGELRPHDPDLRFTKITQTDYRPGATHPDWDRCLEALPEDARGWVQKKLGQGATGYAPTDEIVMFMRGGGENGKTTFLVGVRHALGDFYVTVPDKVLTGGQSDHPTEFMPLKGARLAVIEELPGGEWLDGTRLKKAEGSETGMTARPIGQDNVTWAPSHCLVATTNHLIQITDVDHGTRRRLCDLNFPHTFSGEDRDGGLKLRVKQGKSGQHEAVLAWLVAGAMASYSEPLEREHMPFNVRADTDRWLMATNPAEEFLSEALVHSPEHSVLTKEVYALYRAWAADNGRRVLSDKVFWERARQAAIFTLPDVKKDRVRQYGSLMTMTDVEADSLQRVITSVAYTGEYREKMLFG